MTTSSEAATAAAMPTRRAILATGAALAAATGATVAVASADPVPQPTETPIQAMGRRWSELRRRIDDMEARWQEAHGQYVAMRPAVPDTLRIADRRALFDIKRRPGLNVIHPPHDEDPFGRAEGFRHLVENPVRTADGKINVERLEWARTCLPIAVAFEAADAEAKRASGYDAAENALDELYPVVWQIERQIMAEAATSVADLQIQASVFERASRGLEVDEDLLADLLRSIGGLG